MKSAEEFYKLVAEPSEEADREFKAKGKGVEVGVVIEDGKFTNFEAAIVLDAVNSVTGLLRE